MLTLYHAMDAAYAGDAGSKRLPWLSPFADGDAMDVVDLSGADVPIIDVESINFEALPTAKKRHVKEER